MRNNSAFFVFWVVGFAGMFLSILWLYKIEPYWAGILYGVSLVLMIHDILFRYMKKKGDAYGK